MLSIAIAEFGYKTLIVTIVLATRFVEPAAVFPGALSAFALVDGLSIVLADRLSEFQLAKSKGCLLAYSWCWEF